MQWTIQHSKTESPKIRAARKEKKLTLEQLAEDIGISVSQMSRYESGDREPSFDEAIRIAERIGLPILDLANQTKPIAVMGQVGAGAEIRPDFEQVPPDGLYEINCDIPLPDGMIGFEVEGDSMWPRYDPGDIVICSEAGTAAENLHSGDEAALRTSDGRRFLKRVRREGSAWTLESHNAAPIRGVQIEWASEIVTVVRARQWRKLDSKRERASAIRKAVKKK